ncbi:MAG: helix-turn-helix transcriptional regulator, partial [Alphaproteobacteria bacterium]|nr:helix-turn-helix transcriptional regulator [Alphaproteobacteria bacterium]
MNQVDIGKYLAGKREEAKLSQKELAEKLCTREWKVSRWEKGKTLPNDFELLKLCEIFGITRIEILMGKDLSENEKHENSEKLIQHFWRIRGEHRLSVIIELLFWA